MTLGYFEYDEFRRTVYYYITQVVFTVFLVFMPILLLNMLIAMMGNTYCQVIEQSEKEWVKQWAKIVVALERAVSQKKARNYMDCYSIPIAGANEGQENRAVMVIRRKLKSKARQRKGALSNWKRMGRRVIFQLKREKKASEAVQLNNASDQNEKSDMDNENINNDMNSNILNSGMLDNVCSILEAYSIDNCLPSCAAPAAQEGSTTEKKEINVETRHLAKNVEESRKGYSLLDSKPSFVTVDIQEKKEYSLLESNPKFTSSPHEITSQEVTVEEKKEINVKGSTGESFFIKSNQKLPLSGLEMSPRNVIIEKKSELKEKPKYNSFEIKEKTERKICKKRKKHIFAKSKVGVLTSENRLDTVNNWTNDSKLYPVRPKTSRKCHHLKMPETSQKKKICSRKRVRLSKSTSLEELKQYSRTRNSIKQKKLTHWSTKDVVDTKELMVWNDFQEEPFEISPFKPGT